MNPTVQKVLIVPCSGIGKPTGTVSREAAYAVTEDLRPGQSQLIPLALLVLGDIRIPLPNLCLPRRDH